MLNSKRSDLLGNLSCVTVCLFGKIAIPFPTTHTHTHTHCCCHCQHQQSIYTLQLSKMFISTFSLWVVKNKEPYKSLYDTLETVSCRHSWGCPWISDPPTFNSSVLGLLVSGNGSWGFPHPGQALYQLSSSPALSTICEVSGLLFSKTGPFSALYFHG